MELNDSLRQLSGKSLISISDLNFEQIHSLIDLALNLKNNKINFNSTQKTLGLIFDKSSTRTRVSFEVAMNRLGANTIEINPGTSQIGRGEPIKDTARVLSRYLDALAIRTYDQRSLEEYKKWGDIPIINALTDLEHPCQILADFLTIKEEYGKFDDIVISYFGDGNNIANSLILCGAILGVKIKIGCPEDFKPDKEIVKKSFNLSKDRNLIEIYHEPLEAIKDANVIYTDVWASMGQESQALEREKLFKDFSVNEQLIKHAREDHIILHCLPAYRGKEISDSVMESTSSRIFRQSENRLHIQQALLVSIFS